MDNSNKSNQEEYEIAGKMEAICNETIVKVKAIEQEQKRVLADYIKQLEQKKIEKIKESLSN